MRLFFKALLLATLLIASRSPAQVVRPVTILANEDFGAGVALDAAGTVVYGVASANPAGVNSGFRRQIFRWDAVTGEAVRVTDFEEGVLTVSATDAADLLAFVSNGDLTGGNHDESPELFMIAPDGTGLVQLTFDPGLIGHGVYDAVIAGAGGRVIFLSDTDPVGTNPGRTPHLFAVAPDGSALTQVAEASSSVGWDGLRFFDVSDDGDRIVFLSRDAGGRDQVFAVQADGSGLRQITSGGASAASVRISGNGAKIVYGSGGYLSIVNWDGSGLVSPLVPNPCYDPSITDDGSMVVYTDADLNVRKVASDGTGDLQLIAAVPPLSFFYPVVAGGGGRVAVRSQGGQVPGGDNPDASPELIAMNGDGGAVTQLTNNTVTRGDCEYPSIVPDGSRVYFVDAADLVGANPSRSPQVFVVNGDGSGLAQVTHLTDGAVLSYSVSDAGLVVFSSQANPLGQNPCNNRVLFKINTNGTGLSQLTPGSCPNFYSNLNPRVRPDGAWVIFQSTLRIGTNTDGSAELFKVAADGTGLAPLTADDDGVYKHYHIGDQLSPTWLAFDSQSNFDGKNPDHSYEVFMMKLDGTGLRRLTQDPAYDSMDPDISGNGSRVVWTSRADPLGTNPDHSLEVFLFEKATSVTRQLTNTTGGIYAPVRISRDGAWLFYWKDGTIVRQGIDTGVLERVMGFGHTTTAIGWPEFSDLVGLDKTGSRAVFCAQDDVDASPSSFSPFIADQTFAGGLYVGKDAPTLVTWDPDPQSIRYDVIRGDVSSLSIGSGGEVDLGPVTCIEDDSPDNHTRGHDDVVQPEPGQTFFYLVRGTLGVPPTTGSWGQGSGGRERVAGAGSCNP